LTATTAAAARVAWRNWRFGFLVSTAATGRFELDDLIVTGFKMFGRDVEGTELNLVRGGSCGGRALRVVLRVALHILILGRPLLCVDGSLALLGKRRASWRPLDDILGGLRGAALLRDGGFTLGDGTLLRRSFLGATLLRYDLDGSSLYRSFRLGLRASLNIGLSTSFNLSLGLTLGNHDRIDGLAMTIALVGILKRGTLSKSTSNLRVAPLSEVLVGRWGAGLVLGATRVTTMRSGISFHWRSLNNGLSDHGFRFGFPFGLFSHLADVLLVVDATGEAAVDLWYLGFRRSAFRNVVIGNGASTTWLMSLRESTSDLDRCTHTAQGIEDNSGKKNSGRRGNHLGTSDDIDTLSECSTTSSRLVEDRLWATGA
jgi:hypothetical protein